MHSVRTLVEPRLVTVPAGQFWMGENDDDKFANDTERPRHLVTIGKPFHVGVYPVTVGEFRTFHPSHPADQEELPVVEVSWREAQAYCAFLRETLGRPFRLLSETEWEYAARAGSSTPYPWGCVASINEANFSYDEHGDKIGRGHRTPVGIYPANAFGLHDMHGNVCEWVADQWHPTYYGAPADGTAWTSGNVVKMRVLRGGAWDYLPRLLRSSWRDSLNENSRRDNIGFRVACDL